MAWDYWSAGVGGIGVPQLQLLDYRLWEELVIGINERLDVWSLANLTLPVASDNWFTALNLQAINSKLDILKDYFVDPLIVPNYNTDWHYSYNWHRSFGQTDPPSTAFGAPQVGDLAMYQFNAGITVIVDWIGQAWKFLNELRWIEGNIVTATREYRWIDSRANRTFSPPPILNNSLTEAESDTYVNAHWGSTVWQAGTSQAVNGNFYSEITNWLTPYWGNISQITTPGLSPTRFWTGVSRVRNTGDVVFPVTPQLRIEAYYQRLVQSWEWDFFTGGPINVVGPTYDPSVSLILETTPHAGVNYTMPLMGNDSSIPPVKTSAEYSGPTIQTIQREDWTRWVPANKVKAKVDFVKQV